MAVYAIGDIQGCWREFKALLKKLRLKDSDELWLAGDLINRGPDSLKVLRKLRAMDQQVHIVLGNHDLHFLAIVFGGHNAGAKDTFAELLGADDVEDLAHWLRAQKSRSGGPRKCPKIDRFSRPMGAVERDRPKIASETGPGGPNTSPDRPGDAPDDFRTSRGPPGLAPVTPKRSPRRPGGLPGATREAPRKAA